MLRSGLVIATLQNCNTELSIDFIVIFRFTLQNLHPLSEVFVTPMRTMEPICLVGAA